MSPCLSLATVLLVAGSFLTLSEAAGQIGVCNNTILANIVNDNALFCSVDILQTVYSISPYVKFRVFHKKIADAAKCVTGVLTEPVDNVANFTVTFTDSSSNVLVTEFTVSEAKCGFVFKNIRAENHTSFKLAFSYTDGITLGYYGCSIDSDGRDEEIVYGVCLASTHLPFQSVIDASLQRCRDHMAEVTGSQDLVILPDCEN